MRILIGYLVLFSTLIAFQLAAMETNNKIISLDENAYRKVREREENLYSIYKEIELQIIDLAQKYFAAEKFSDYKTKPNTYSITLAIPDHDQYVKNWSFIYKNRRWDLNTLKEKPESRPFKQDKLLTTAEIFQNIGKVLVNRNQKNEQAMYCIAYATGEKMRAIYKDIKESLLEDFDENDITCNGAFGYFK